MVAIAGLTAPLMAASASGAQAALTLEPRRSEHTGGSCASDRGEWCTRLTLNWTEVVGGTSEEAAAAINRGTRDWLLRGIFEAAPQSTDELAAELQNGFRDLRAEFPEYALPWWVERRATVATNTPAVLALAMYEDMYTGGAHGAHALTYANYAPATGAVIALTDVVGEADLPELNEIAETIFRRDKGMDADTSLDAAGFWFDGNTFALNDNFLVGEAGLTFYFNEYEISSYADGPTELVLPYETIRHLIRAAK